MYGYECIDHVSNNFVQTTHIFSAKEKKSPVYLCVSINRHSSWITYFQPKFCPSWGSNFFCLHLPPSLHNLVQMCFELSSSEQVQTTFFSQKSLNELSFFPPLPFPPRLQHICVTCKPALLWSFAEVHYINPKLGLLSVFCPSLCLSVWVTTKRRIVTWWVFFPFFCFVLQLQCEDFFLICVWLYWLVQQNSCLQQWSS